MLKLGEKQKLQIVKRVDFGVYLADPAKGPETKERVLLPIKQVPADSKIGDTLVVFLYKDSKDRMIATTREPKLMMGEVATLEVAQMGKYGAFLDWGLEKDLLLPFKQQKKRLRQGEQVLVSLYLDKSERLCATMNVYPNLRTDSPYEKDAMVTGRVYEISDQFGAFVAVDDLYCALIPTRELYGEVNIGENVQARVVSVLEDGKLTLSIREKSYLQIGKDADQVMQLIERYDGVLPFHDKVSPEIIKRETGMSKNQFKKAVGHLLKEGKIQIKDKVIRKITP